MPLQPSGAPFFSGTVDGAPSATATAFDAWPDRPLLASMEAGGIDWPSSCRNGTCRTCLGQLVAGRVRHVVAWPGLSSDELATGYTLPCVAHPLGNVCIRRAD